MAPIKIKFEQKDFFCYKSFFVNPKQEHTRKMSHSTVYLDKKLNKENSSEFRDKILDSIEKNKITFISFKNVIYIDKEGLNTLIELLEYSKKQKKKLKLSELKPEIIEIMNFTNLSNLFKMYNNLHEASE